MVNYTVEARWQERPLALAEKIQELAKQKELIAAKQSEIQKIVTETNDKISAEARSHLGDYLLLAAQQERTGRRLAQRQPFGGQADLAKLSGAIVLEAEDYVRGN